MANATISSRLKQIMQERGLRQVDILRKCKPYCEKYNVKIGRSDLSQYISGRIQPKQYKLTILALALNVNEMWLMGLDEPTQQATSMPGIHTGRQNNKATLSGEPKLLPEEKELLRLFGILDSADKTNLKNYITNVLLLADKYGSEK